MLSEAPPFWWQPADWRARLLAPAAAVYAAVSDRRMRAAPRRRVDLPVLCVGNLTVGGSGKTPVSIALAGEARRQGLQPGFLSRGHGGQARQAHLVDPEHDSPRHVGDEPLLLARHAPVAVTADREAGARLLAGRGCTLLIMDDGFQSARLHMDFALLVVDARHGIGNGYVIPAGPLRASLGAQLRLCHGVLRMGEGEGAEAVVRAAARAAKPIYAARAVPVDPARFAGRRLLAFAGIGNPDRFFDTLRATGARVEAVRPFPDHHPYTDEDLAQLADDAAAARLELATTAKDAVRLRDRPAPVAFMSGLDVLEIEARFEDRSMAERIVAETLAAWRRRRGT